MNDTPSSDLQKQHMICTASAQLFAQYGFRRTSMEDIAQAAGMSRPALYQHFRNKEDIFRTLVRQYYDGCAKDLDNVLSRSGTVSEKLQRAFVAIGGPMVEALLGSPHGEELMDATTGQNADVKAAGEARLAGRLAAWLWAESEMGRITLEMSADETAALILMAHKGVKAPPLASYVKKRDQLATMLALGLTAAR